MDRQALIWELAKVPVPPNGGSSFVANISGIHGWASEDQQIEDIPGIVGDWRCCVVSKELEDTGLIVIVASEIGLLDEITVLAARRII